MRFLSLCTALSLAILGYGQTSKRAEKAESKYKPLLKNELRKAGLNQGSPLFLRIFKEENNLEIWVKRDTAYQLFKTYEICYFSGGLGPKRKQGDSKSPEGFYETKPDAMNPHSSYHLSFNTGYPNAFDRANGYTGSALMIHGNCVSIGCYAMGDNNIEEIWSLLKLSFEGGNRIVSIHIFPFKMSDSAMQRHKNHAEIKFWKNLKTGYDYFEKWKRPPSVGVKNKQYVFN